MVSGVRYNPIVDTMSILALHLRCIGPRLRGGVSLREAFQKILQAHLSRYPLMEPQDCVKLAYQSALGPGHEAPDRASALRALLREWGELPSGVGAKPPEDIGNGLCRFHLAGTDDLPLAAPLLADLFRLTARQAQGTPADLEQNLAALEPLTLPGMAAYLAAYRERGCPAVHHSERFRAAYAPHYRVLTSACAGYFPALLRIARLLRRGAPVIAAVDGRCGSGKSGLAELIGTLFPCSVIHMDDYYLPPDQRAEGWEHIPGGNMDFARFLREVLVPAGGGEAIRCRPFDCRSGTLGREVLLPDRQLTVVEGSYSQHPLLTARYDLKLFLTCAPEEQRRRLKRREGGHYAAFRSRWMPLEEQYFRQCGTERSADLVIDTTGFF